MATVRVADNLWVSSMLPEGIVERWLVADGANVAQGEAIVELRIEDALHDVQAPIAGRLMIATAVNCVIEPGTMLGEVTQSPLVGQ